MVISGSSITIGLHGGFHDGQLLASAFGFGFRLASAFVFGVDCGLHRRCQVVVVAVVSFNRCGQIVNCCVCSFIVVVAVEVLLLLLFLLVAWRTRSVGIFGIVHSHSVTWHDKF